MGSSAPDHAYRATDPAAVKESIDRYNEQRLKFFEAMEEYGEELGHKIVAVGDNTRMWANHLDGDWRRDGLYAKPEGSRPSAQLQRVADIPPGWHYYVKKREVQPHHGGKDKAAKDVRARMKEINALSPSGLATWLTREFGVQGTPPFNNYGFETVGDDYFVLMRRRDGFGASYEWDGNEHFEKVPMSTYWLAKESVEEESAE